MRVRLGLLKRRKKATKQPTGPPFPLSQLHASSRQVCGSRPASQIYSLFQDFSARLRLWKHFLLTNKGAGARGSRGTQQPEMKNQTHPSLMRLKQKINPQTVEATGLWLAEGVA